ncbi:MAG: VWA domain-containing protein [Candidatus Parcubacteria bacterium]|nr:VWA domain-containing protein [Candidatus Parcubacteria bacterium]
MTRDIRKKEKGSGLNKPTGAPDLKKMKAQLASIMPPGSKLAKVVQPAAERYATKPSLQVVMMFDITGSMFPYFELVRKKIQDIISAVKKESPDAEFAIFAYRNHGDEDKYKQIYYTFPLSRNLEALFSYLCTITKGGGGPDALTCLEDCLMEATKLAWDVSCPKAIVIIGDMPPHGVLDSVAHCYKGIDYRQEVGKLKAKAVKIYTVYCESQNSKSQKVRDFYQSLAKANYGKFLEIADLDILIELLIAICLKETGNLDKFLKQLEQTGQLKEPQKKALLMLKG